MPPKDLSLPTEKDTAPDPALLDVLSGTLPDLAHYLYAGEIDLMAYAALLDDMDGTDDQKLICLRELCVLSIQTIELSYGIGPTAKTCGQVIEATVPAADPVGIMVGSDDTHITDTEAAGTERSAS